MDPQAIAQIRRSCTRFLNGHYRPTPQQALTALAAYTDPEFEADNYGSGAVINDLESQVAQILGKDAAVFMPSGTMCQQIALRIHAENAGTKRVGFHPLCHLEIHEQQGYQELHGLRGVLLGDATRLMTLADLQAVAEPLAALLVELPQREIGGQLPAWDDLVALTEYARSHGIALHMDGARLWQCNSFYGRNYAEIAALFDTVYVSFYKDLGGIAGAILAGNADFVTRARVWQRRHGGNLYQLFPFVLAARKGLADHLDRMPEYYAKAQSLATALSELSQVGILPNPPQTNMMHIYLHGDRQRLINASLEIAQETGIFLFGALRPTTFPDLSIHELTVGDATLDLPDDEIVDLFKQVFARAA